MNKNLCELVVNPEIEAEMLEKSSFCEMQECYFEKQYGYLTAIENKREEIREKLEKGINYIRENDKDVFIYDMLSPRALSYFLNIDTIRQLKEIDYSIFKQNCVQYNRSSELIGNGLEGKQGSLKN